MLKQATLHFSRAPNLPFVDPQMSSQAVRQEMMALGTQVARLKGILRAEWKRRSACGGGGGAILADGQSLLLLWRHTFSRRCSVGIF